MLLYTFCSALNIKEFHMFIQACFDSNLSTVFDIVIRFGNLGKSALDIVIENFISKQC